MRRAFTLAELLVLLAVIAIALSIAAPAVHKLHLQAQQAAATQVFGGAMITAQAEAKANFTTAAVRIERAFETDTDGRMMTNADGTARWRTHQQIRLVATGRREVFGPLVSGKSAFRQLAHTGVTRLPRLIWLAPGHALSGDTGKSTVWQPSAKGTVAFDALETFYVVFGRNGELKRMPAGAMVYLDQTQGDQLVDHPDPSASSVLLYDRQAFEQAAGDVTYLREALPLYINRYTGGVVPGDQGVSWPPF